jgi:Tfp pilus assembly protein PilX
MTHKHAQRGDIVVAMLFFMVAFVVIMIAGSRLTALQFNRTVRQEQVEHTFDIAEAGVYYGQWLLNIVGLDPTTLSVIQYGATCPPCQLTDPVTGKVLGTFRLEFSTSVSGGVTTVSLTSRGINSDTTARQQVIQATLKRYRSDTPYLLTSWDYLR